MKIRKWFASVLAALLVAGGLTVVTALPASANNTNITCTTAWLEPHRALQNGDHINIDVSIDGKTSQVNAYVDRNIEGGWDTLGLRLTTPKGQIQVPLTEAEVKSGRLTFNFGQYIEGAYGVQWAQFNNSYFNADRNPYKFLECGKTTPPVKPEPLTGTEDRKSEPVCVEPLDGTATVTTETRTWTQEPVWSEKKHDWVFGEKVFSDWKVTDTKTVESEDCEPEEPVVVPAKPSAEIAPTCGEATITLRNDAGKDALTASFVVEVDGEFYGAYAVETGKEEVVTVAFEEDSGNHDVEVFQAGTSEYKSLATATVETDCQLPPVEVPETEVVTYWEYADYDCDNVPGDVIIDRFVTETTTYGLIDGQVVPSTTTEVIEFPYTLTEEDFEGLECEGIVVPPAKPPVTPPTSNPSPDPTPSPSASPAPSGNDVPSDDVLPLTGSSFNPWIATGFAAFVILTALSTMLFARARDLRRSKS